MSTYEAIARARIDGVQAALRAASNDPQSLMHAVTVLGAQVLMHARVLDRIVAALNEQDGGDDA